MVRKSQEIRKSQVKIGVIEINSGKSLKENKILSIQIYKIPYI